MKKQLSAKSGVNGRIFLQVLMQLSLEMGGNAAAGVAQSRLPFFQSWSRGDRSFPFVSLNLLGSWTFWFSNVSLFDKDPKGAISLFGLRVRRPVPPPSTPLSLLVQRVTSAFAIPGR